MAVVVFYEKPGCINNTKQKQLLRQAGHKVEAHNLLETEWTAERLQRFFGDLPVAQWFNQSAPKVKSGYVNPDTIAAEDALALMVSEPLLIRRPLMEIEGEYYVGFDADKIDKLIGLAAVEAETDLETCPRTHTETSCEPGK
jgi:nitrogenase-associated protein